MANKYNIRMLATKEKEHLSGAEYIVDESDLSDYAQQLIQRALSHSRGKADFLSLKVEALQEPIRSIPPVSKVVTYSNLHPEQTVKSLGKILQPLSFSEATIQNLYEHVINEEQFPGAQFVDITTGKRLNLENRPQGIRVSRLDWIEEAKQSFVKQHPDCRNQRSLEAIALATKVQEAGVLAEICCSDDPEYTTGYVRFQDTYIRIPHMKELGHPFGGRLFLIEPKAVSLPQIIYFLEKEPVLIGEVP